MLGIEQDSNLLVAPELFQRRGQIGRVRHWGGSDSGLSSYSILDFPAVVFSYRIKTMQVLPVRWHCWISVLQRNYRPCRVESFQHHPDYKTPTAEFCLCFKHDFENRAQQKRREARPNLVCTRCNAALPPLHSHPQVNLIHQRSVGNPMLTAAGTLNHLAQMDNHVHSCLPGK